jgi:hypothetical protein
MEKWRMNRLKKYIEDAARAHQITQIINLKLET